MSEAIRLKASKVIRATPETEIAIVTSSDDDEEEEEEYPLEDEYYEEDGDITVGEQYSIEEALTEEDRKQKILYICMIKRGTFTNMLRTDPDDLSERRELELRKDYPSGMVDNQYYSVAILHSKVFFIGGYNGEERQTLNQVSVFDLASSTWDTAPSMNQERASPVVLTYKNKIYAFGFVNTPQFRSRDAKNHPAHFAEFLDPSDKKKWVYLPAHQFPNCLRPMGSSIKTHALNEPQGVLYCMFNCCGIYSYTFETGIWSYLTILGMRIFSPPSRWWWFDSPLGLWWSNSSVFLNDILFWHYLGTIYAYRFSDRRILRLCTFNSCSRRFLGRYPNPSYLVNVGNAKLCLVYARQHFLDPKLDQKTIWCHTFAVQFFRTSVPDVTAVSLVHQGCQTFPHPDAPCGLACVFAMDREVDRESGRGPRDEDRAKGQEREQYCFYSPGEKDDGWQKPKQKNRRAKIHKDKQKKCVVYGTEHPTPETSDHNNRFRHLSKC